MDISLVGLGLGYFCYIGGFTGGERGVGIVHFSAILSINKQNLAEKQKGF